MKGSWQTMEKKQISNLLSPKQLGKEQMQLLETMGMLIEKLNQLKLKIKFFNSKNKKYSKIISIHSKTKKKKEKESCKKKL